MSLVRFPEAAPEPFQFLVVQADQPHPPLLSGESAQIWEETKEEHVFRVKTAIVDQYKNLYLGGPEDSAGTEDSKKGAAVSVRDLGGSVAKNVGPPELVTFSPKTESIPLGEIRWLMVAAIKKAKERSRYRKSCFEKIYGGSQAL